MSRAQRAAGLLLGAARVGVALLPRRVRRAIEDRFFYAVFNVTRVTNDAYGWRPEGEVEGNGERPAASRGAEQQEAG